jgi:segregation and condensation protein B
METDMTKDEPYPLEELDQPHTSEELDQQQELDIESESLDMEEADLSQEENLQPTMTRVIEAVLFASDEPLSAARLAEISETGSVKTVREHIERLNKEYKANNSSFRIEQIAGGYQMLTLDVYNSWLRKLHRVRSESKLSQAALETLAIIAYKQPVIRADVEVIRGVACGEMIRSLVYKGLVKIVGKAEVLGRPLLYGTTRKFLQVFCLNSLKDLPTVEELKKPE